MDINWKYYIPHTWEDNEKFRWADIWLLPDKSDYKGDSLWLTIDALGNSSDIYNEEQKEYREEMLQKLGDRDFYCDDEKLDMIVRADNFTKEEFLKWVKVCITHKGFPCKDLVESTFEDFKDTNEQAKVIYNISESLKDNQQGE